jgi:hypothetical protein
MTPLPRIELNFAVAICDVASLYGSGVGSSTKAREGLIVLTSIKFQRSAKSQLQFKLLSDVLEFL